MRLAIASVTASWEQVKAVYGIDFNTLTLPDKTLLGKLIVIGGRTIYKCDLMKKKWHNMKSNDLQNLFEVINMHI